MSLEALLSEMVKQKGVLSSSECEQTPEKLKEILEIFQQKNIFAVGDIVEWKPYMANRKIEAKAVVVEVLSEPVYDQKNLSAGTPMFREPLDIVVGYFDNEDFMLFHLDSRRLQPVK